MKITGVVLAGGKSSRFGQDKGLFVFHGKPLVMHAIEILEPVCSEVIISTNRVSDYDFTGKKTFEDIFSNCGPLGGIHSGLHNASFDRVIFLGCDMPMVPTQLISFLVNNMQGFQAVIPCHGTFHETLCMAIHRSAIDATQNAILQNKFKILDMLELLRARFVDVSAMPFFSPQIFANINFRSDIERLNSPGSPQ